MELYGMMGAEVVKMAFFDFFRRKTEKPPASDEKKGVPILKAEPEIKFTVRFDGPRDEKSEENFVTEKPEVQKPIHYEPKGLTTVEKERILVARVTQKDMEQFTMIPYQLNCEVKKIGLEDRSGHPFAYMDLNEANQFMAKKEIEKINDLIVEARTYIRKLPEWAVVDVEKIAFEEYDPGYGYTRIMCTPHTLTGKVAKNPLHLLFMTRLDIHSYQANGRMYYGTDGSVLKAVINIYKNGKSWHFDFKTIGRTFLLSTVKSSINPDKYGMPGIVYKFES